MHFALAALTALIGAVSAVTLNTPSAITQCQPVLLQWSEGTAPYWLTIIPAGQTAAAPLVELLADSDVTQFTWTVSLAAGTAVNFKLTDGTGATSYTSALTVLEGSTSCLNASSSAAPAASGTETGSESAAAPSETAASVDPTSAAPTSAAPATTSASAASASSKAAASSSKAAASSSKAASGSASAAAAAATSGAASMNVVALPAVAAAVAGALLF